MRKKRFLATVTLGLLATLSSPHASAIGWSRAQLSAVLGQPLDFNASLRLDPGDAPVAPNCVSAEVLAGERRLAADSYRVMVDTSSPDAVRMRVLTRQAMDEPFITVTLAIGCPARMSRRFVLLADPPGHAMQPVVQAAVQTAAPAPTSPPPPPSPSVSPSAAPEPSRVIVAAAAAPVPPARSAASPRQDRAAPAPAPRRERAAPAPRPRPAEAPAPAPVTAGPRLQLDPVEPAPTAQAAAPDVIDEALQAVAEATRAAQAIAAAASASEARMLQLERTVEQLRTEAKVNQDLAADLRRRLADRDGAGRWFVPLLLALLALAALAGWLWLRLRALEREQQAAWRRAAAAAAPSRPPPRASQVPMVTSEIMTPTPVAPAPVAPQPARAYSPFTPLKAPHAASPQAAPPSPPAAAAADHGPPVTAAERTDVLPRDSQPDAPRDVSIDELLDLEQQAEFFIVLGQDDAAIDLLVEHLRSTGGGSPLPYLKLLEIYRRLDDRAAYDRTRARFNHRFNAYAPDWDVDPAAGRALEDYPGIVPRLQQAWARPLDAMAELEALLFRKSRGELFDLPAYREVLFLYSLARDLLDRESVDTGSVDLLLPLADGGEFSSTSPHPYFGLERESVFDPLHDEHPQDRPTAPVDLDLTQPDEPAALTERLTPRR